MFDNKIAKQLSASFRKEERQDKEILPQLNAQREALLYRVKKIDEIIEVINKNPDFEKVYFITQEILSYVP